MTEKPDFEQMLYDARFILSKMRPTIVDIGRRGVLLKRDVQLQDVIIDEGYHKSGFELTMVEHFNLFRRRHSSGNVYVEYRTEYGDEEGDYIVEGTVNEIDLLWGPGELAVAGTYTGGDVVPIADLDATSAQIIAGLLEMPLNGALKYINETKI